MSSTRAWPRPDQAAPFALGVQKPAMILHIKRPGLYPILDSSTLRLYTPGASRWPGRLPYLENIADRDSPPYWAAFRETSAANLIRVGSRSWLTFADKDVLVAGRATTGHRRRWQAIGLLERMTIGAVGDQLDRRDEGLIGCLCRGVEFSKGADGVVARICFLHPDSPGIVHIGGCHGRALGEKQQRIQTEEQPGVMTGQHFRWDLALDLGRQLVEVAHPINRRTMSAT